METEVASKWFYWDPPSVWFTLPIIEHPITFYAICFICGFLVAYALVTRMVAYRLEHGIPGLAGKGSLYPAEEARKLAGPLVDKLIWCVIIGMIVGARLGYCFAYDWHSVKADPLMIFRVWEGGLASHFGAIGIITALFFFRMRVMRTHPQFSFLAILDLVAIPTAFVGMCIRIGNFINQEIVGVVTDVPWAVVFGHARDGSLPAPRHPVVLYEASAYLLIFILLLVLWRRMRDHWQPGRFAGVFFLAVFSARFILEFWKTKQSILIGADSALRMGQYLSLPFIALGAFLLFRPDRNRQAKRA